MTAREAFERVADALTDADGDLREAVAVLRQTTLAAEPLERVASTAAAVLDSEAGVKSLAELAVAVRDADYGDWTDTYPDPERPTR